MEEEWKDIKGYEGRYQVSNLGKVKSLEHYHPCKFWGKISLRHRKEQLLKQWKRSSYLLVDLWKDDIRDVRSVHILVFEAFVGELKEGFNIHHIDENKFNNSFDNLVSMTIIDHVRHHHKGIAPKDRKVKESKSDLYTKYNLSKEERTIKENMKSYYFLKAFGIKEAAIRCSLSIRQVYRRSKMFSQYLAIGE